MYLVGGCVRDLILKRAPKDFDVITSANLYQVHHPLFCFLSLTLCLPLYIFTFQTFNICSKKMVTYVN